MKPPAAWGMDGDTDSAFGAKDSASVDGLQAEFGAWLTPSHRSIPGDILLR